MPLKLYKTSNQAKFDVIDGDTFDIIDGVRSVRARLNGIDAPELSQSFGETAKNWLADHLTAPVIKQRTVDKFDRLIIEVINQDGIALNLEMVRLGFAWVHPYYGKKHSDSDALIIAQNYAIANKLGVHSDPSAQPPWEYRDEQHNEGFTTIVNRVKHQAKLKGIDTYKQLASQCGLTFATAFRYWNDPYAFPSRKILLRICNALEVNISDLLELK